LHCSRSRPSAGRFVASRRQVSRVGHLGRLVQAKETCGWGCVRCWLLSCVLSQIVRCRTTYTTTSHQIGQPAFDRTSLECTQGVVVGRNHATASPHGGRSIEELSAATVARPSTCPDGSDNCAMESLRACIAVSNPAPTIGVALITERPAIPSPRQAAATSHDNSGCGRSGSVPETIRQHRVDTSIDRRRRRELGIGAPDLSRQGPHPRTARPRIRRPRAEPLVVRRLGDPEG